MNSVLLPKSEGDSPEERAVDQLSQLPSRVAKLESDVDGIKKDVSDIKVELGRVDDRLRGADERLNAKIDTYRFRCEDAIDRLRRDLSSAKIWALGLYIVFAAGMLFAMAKGFKWI